MNNIPALNKPRYWLRSNIISSQKSTLHPYLFYDLAELYKVMDSFSRGSPNRHYTIYREKSGWVSQCKTWMSQVWLHPSEEEKSQGLKDLERLA